MRTDRHKKILELINNNNIGTQEELADALNKAGYNVTQATVSRDIREMNLVKIRDELGNTKYAAPVSSGSNIVTLRDSIIHVDSAGNIVVLKCRSGMASAVCAEFDSMHYPNVVGTIAGDDTIFILFRNYVQAEEFKNNYRKD